MKQERNLVKRFKLDKTTWTYKGFHGVLHTFFPLGRVTGMAMKEFFGDWAMFNIFFVKDDYIHWYWNDSDLTRIREEFFKRLAKNKNYLEDLKKQWKKSVKLFDKIILQIDKINIAKLTNNELVILYHNFYERYVDQYRFFMTLGDAISMQADRYLTPEFEKILSKDFNTIFPKLITTQYSSFVEEESIARGKILKILKKGGKIKQTVLENHAKQFFYIQNNYAKGIRLKAGDFEKMIKEDLQKNVEIYKDTRKKQLLEKQKLIKKYKLSVWHKTLLYVLDEFFKLQDTRKKNVLIANYYQFEFLKEAGCRSGISFDLLQYSIQPEFGKILDKTINIKTLKDRQKISVCLHIDNEFKIINGLTAQQTLDFFQKQQNAGKELKGMIASTGKVVGRVKKILKIHDMANMEQGDVLVSSMTRPEMVPAMKLASAIITDEGGITCHAAIVSREMKIPCIIGVKNATQILKDGDVVEVDANKGIVKIIN